MSLFGWHREAERVRASTVGGVDLGGTKIAAAVIGSDDSILGSARRPTPGKGGPADVAEAVAETMREAASEAGVATTSLGGVGVGFPGSVDRVAGMASRAGNLPGWDGDFALGRFLEEELGTTISLGNDVQVGTMAEYRLGAGQGFDSVLGVFWGTGVGGGLILGGAPWLGRGRAGEIGHTIVRRGGARGPNGLRGTVEAYAGRKAMEAKARKEVGRGRKTILFEVMKEKGKKSLTSAVWARAWREDDELARDLLSRAVNALSAGIASAVNLIDPEAVVIGGGLGVRFADTLVPKVIEGTGKYLLEPDRPPVMLPAALGDDGGVLGASLLVRQPASGASAGSAYNP